MQKNKKAVDENVNVLEEEQHNDISNKLSQLVRDTEQLSYSVASTMSRHNVSSMTYTYFYFFLDFLQMLLMSANVNHPWGKYGLIVVTYVESLELINFFGIVTSLNGSGTYSTFFKVYIVSIVFYAIFAIASLFHMYTTMKSKNNPNPKTIYKPGLIEEVASRFSNFICFTMYMTILKLFLSMFNCDYQSSSPNYGLWLHYPNDNVECWGMQHGFSSVLAIFFVPIHIFFGLVAELRHTDFNSKSKMYMKRYFSNSGVEFFWLKTTWCILHFITEYILTYQSILLVYIVYSLLSVSMASVTYRVNHLFILQNVALSLLLWFNFFVCLLLLGGGDTQGEALFWFMVLGIIPVVISSTYYFRRELHKVLSFYESFSLEEISTYDTNISNKERESPRNSEEEGYRFSELMFPALLNFATLNNKEDEESVQIANYMCNRALSWYPKNCLVALTHYQYLLNVLKEVDSANFHLENARKLAHSYAEKFFFFQLKSTINIDSRKLLHSQKMTIAQYVEFQNKLKVVLVNHKHTLVEIRKFWRIVHKDRLSQVILTNFCKTMEKLENETSVNYQEFLFHYPTNIQLLKGYGHFLAEVQLNYKKSKVIFEEIDKVLKQNYIKERENNEERVVETEKYVDSKRDAIVLINEHGVIISANIKCMELFGYEENELVGRNVSALMPAPYKQMHNVYLQNYKNNGVSKVIGKERKFEGEHKKGHTFPITLLVSKIETPSGMTLAGVINEIREDESISKITIDMIGNIISCNKYLLEMFGYSYQEVMGKNVKMLMPTRIAQFHDQYLESFRNNSKTTGSLVGVGGRRLEALHKNGVTFIVNLVVTIEKQDNIDVYVGEFFQMTDQSGTVSINDSGIIQTYDNKFAQIFGYKSTTELIGRQISIIMPEPYNKLHNSFVSNYITSGISQVINQKKGRQFTAKHGDGSEFPVNIIVTEAWDDNGEVIFSAEITPLNNDSHLSDINLHCDSSGVIQFVDEISFEILGFSKDEMTSQNIDKFIDTDECKKDFGSLIMPLKSVNTKGGQYVILNPKNGIPLPASVHLEEEIYNNEACYFVTLKLLQDLEGVIVIDLSGKILNANLSFLHLFGKNLHDIKGKKLSELTSLTMTEIQREISLSFLKSRAAIFTHNDGTQILALVNFVSSLDFGVSVIMLRVVLPRPAPNSKAIRIKTSISKRKKSTNREEPKIVKQDVNRRNLLKQKTNQMVELSRVSKEKRQDSKLFELIASAISTKKTMAEKEMEIQEKQSEKILNDMAFEEYSKIKLDLDEKLQENIQWVKSSYIYLVIFMITFSIGSYAFSQYLHDIHIDKVKRVHLATQRTLLTEQIALQSRLLQVRGENSTLADALNIGSFSTILQNIKLFSNTLEINHKLLYLGVSTLEQPPTSQLLSQYDDPRFAVSFYIPVIPSFTTEKYLGLWDFGRNYVISSWAVSGYSDVSINFNTSDLKFIHNNVDSIISIFSQSESLEYDGVKSIIDYFSIWKICTDYLCFFAPLVVFIVLLRGYFKIFEEGRLSMFNLFKVTPKDITSSLSLLKIDLSFMKENDNDDNDIYKEEEENEDDIDEIEALEEEEDDDDNYSGDDNNDSNNSVGKFSFWDKVRKFKIFIPHIVLVGTFVFSTLSFVSFYESYAYITLAQDAVYDLQLAGTCIHLAAQIRHGCLDLFIANRNSDTSALKSNILSLVNDYEEAQRLIFYGNNNGKQGSLKRSNVQDALLFLPSCLRLDESCVDPSDIYYQITTNGLNELINFYLDQAVTYATSENQIAGDAFEFIWNYGDLDILDGLQRKPFIQASLKEYNRVMRILSFIR